MTGRLARPKVELMGVTFDAVTLDEALGEVARLMDGPGLARVVTANLDYMAKLRRSAELESWVRDADLVVADGVPLLWMARWTRQVLPGRVNGTDLVVRLLQSSSDHGWPVALLGGDPGVAEAAGRRARGDWGTPVAGTWPLSREEVDDPARSRAVAAEVGALGSPLVLVGIGAGRQDEWIDANRHFLGEGVAIGVGSALDFVAGTRRRAPTALQRAGLEWFWRLSLEPGRLWRRYLLEDLPLLVSFAAMAMRDRVGGG